MNYTTNEMLSTLLMVWVECVLFQKKIQNYTKEQFNHCCEEKMQNTKILKGKYVHQSNKLPVRLGGWGNPLKLNQNTFREKGMRRNAIQKFVQRF